NLKEYTQLESPPSNIVTSDTSVLVSLIGTLDPSELDVGALVHVDKNFTEEERILKSLQRPVDFKSVDLNDDQQSDFIVCSFGNFTGQLLAFEKVDTGYVKHVLSHSPGARNIILNDVNRDGRMDILALFTQGNERISVF